MKNNHAMPISCVVILISPPLCCAAIIMIYIIFIVRPSPLPFYESAAVIEICQIFGFDAEDEFCANPTEQNGFTFQKVLQHYFPRENTFYEDIMPLVETRSMRPSYELLDESGSSAIGFCRKEEEKAYPYVCYILFSYEGVRLTIFFDSTTGEVRRYGALKPGS